MIRSLPAMSEVPLRLVPAPPRAMSVAELNRTIKAGIEEKFPSVWVEGEITARKVAGTGHVYFDLKDEREEALREWRADDELADNPGEGMQAPLPFGPFIAIAGLELVLFMPTLKEAFVAFTSAG